MGNLCLRLCGSARTGSSEPTPKPQCDLSRSANTVQTNPPTSEASSDRSYRKSPASSSQGNNVEHVPTTVQENRGPVTTSTPPFKNRAATPQRVRSQDWESSQPHRDGTNYLPTFGDVLAPQDPRRHGTFPDGTRLRSSVRLNRMNSEDVSGNNGRTPRYGPFLTPGAGQVPAEGQDSRQRFPSTLQGLLANERFRILVVGKRDSGKSSLIKTIFKVDMSGSPINISGRTTEFRPPDNRHLIVHECAAFGPGEMQAIRDFVIARNNEDCPASERLHAIWICVPISDVIDGQFDAGVKLLLDIGVPLVVAFTKFDLIVPKVSSNTAGGNDNRRVKAVYAAREGQCRSLFGDVPTEIVSTRPSFRDLIDKLVQTTDRLILAHSRKIAALPEAQSTQPRMSLVPLAWSVSQRASRDINILTAIEVGRSKYWRGLWSGDDFRGQTLASCIKVIHGDIVGVWNLPDKDRYLSSQAFRNEISFLVQDSSGSSTSTSSRPKTGPAWLNNHHGNSTEKICLVVGYIIDLTLILCGVFSSRNVSPGEVKSVIDNFTGSGLETSIRNDISSFITTVPQYQYQDNDVIIAKIRDLTLRNCDPPWGNANVSASVLTA